MRNFRITIEYDGTRYNGWQSQGGRKRFRTVQEEVEKTLFKLFRKDVRVTGAGRTDSGVHAEGYVANFKVDTALSPRNIKYALNSLLASDISILDIRPVPLDFHARFDARSKLYRYVILNRDARSPLMARYSSLCTYRLDIDSMKKAAALLIGKKDFRSFQARDKRKRGSVRTIIRIEVKKKRRDIIEIYIESDGFLYNMARNIVGTLIDVGRGRISPDEVRCILKKRDRRFAGATAPAKGLCLVKVRY